MKLGIIGKPQSGKTTIFNAAANMQEAVGDFSQAMHRGVIKVPDVRIDILTEMIIPKKTTYAEISFLDVPGFSGKGKDSEKFEINPEIRQMETLMVVIDGFSSDATPEADIQAIQDEMILIDMALLETNIAKKSKKIKITGDKTVLKEVELLKKCYDFLELEKPLIDLDLTDEEKKLIRGFMFITEKPLLFVINIAESDIQNIDSMLEKMSSFVSAGKRDVTAMCGKIEMELVTLEDDERKMFLEDLGITIPAVENVVQKSYELLGLISYITAAEPEVRAWTIRRGTNAQKSAGVIHSDIERGFIRAEVTSYADYLEFKTPAALKSAGKTRLEGKEYIMQDGDIVLFRFNV